MSQPKHFQWRVEGKVGVITLNRPERKNPLTFESYAELRDLFRNLQHETTVKSDRRHRRRRQLLLRRRRARDHRPADEDGDAAAARVHAHDRRPGEGDAPLPAADRSPRSTASAPAPARSSRMASDLRYAAPRRKTAFLFVRVGLAGCDMGACAILPRIIGQGRAAELLYTGRSMSAEEGLAWGFFNRVGRSACCRSGHGNGEGACRRARRSRTP